LVTRSRYNGVTDDVMFDANIPSRTAMNLR
jgi:hypothetical protein